LPLKQVLSIALLAVVSVSPIVAQAQVSGTVRDSRGTPIPDARVSITNIHTSMVSTATSGADGSYDFANLAPGPYEIQVTQTEFAPHNRTGILLDANSQAKIDVMMQSGADLSHIHLLLNHFPTVGMIIGLGLFVMSLYLKSNDLKRASLVIFVGIALLSIPVYVTGNGAQSTICQAKPEDPCADPTVSKARIEAHEGAALLGLAVMEILGAFAWLGLWQYRRTAR